MLQKIDTFLNRVMSAFLGTFIGYCIFKYWHFHAYPILYAMQSAPWYTILLLYGAVTLAVIILCLILKLVIKRRIRKHSQA